MEDKISGIAIVTLLFIPVVIAISHLFSDYNIFDLIYLLLVGVIFLNYFIKVKVKKSL